MWHVVNTAPNAELQVSRVLGLHGLRTYTAEFRSAKHTRPGSTRDRRHRWVFPGYVFFQAGRDYSSWSHVRSAPGVRRLLEQDGAPAGVEDAVVECLRQRLTALPSDRLSTRFTPGERVVVERGPLAMVDAIVDRCLPARERVSILVHLLGRLIPVEV